MRVVLSTDGSRGDAEPVLKLAVRLLALGADRRVCAPPDFAELPARVCVPLVPIGQLGRPPLTGATPSADLPLRQADWVAAQIDTVTVAGEICDAPVATVVTRSGWWR